MGKHAVPFMEEKENMAETSLTVGLIRYTDSPEEMIGAASRLCYSSDSVEQTIIKTAEKDNAAFIQKLVGMGHMSPFEHASFTFSVEGVSRSLLAQITRHRIASFSVKSQRYVSEARGFQYVIPPSIKALGESGVKKFKEQMDVIAMWYSQWQQLLGDGEKGNEDARFVLPNAAETKFLVTMNARELLHFFKLRCCARAQWEIRELAWRMLELCYGVAPNLFGGAGPSCVSGECSEGKMSCGNPSEMRDRMQKIRRGC